MTDAPAARQPAPPTQPAPPRHSPLHDVHEAAGASFTDFAGWLMPVRYSSDLAEHHAVRSAAGMFDISHMAEVRVEGPAAAAFLDYALAGRLSAIEVGQAKYSLLLDAAGGVIDDLVVYRRSVDHFLVVANAANRVPVVEALQRRRGAVTADEGCSRGGFDATVTDVSDEIALIAVQGPHSRGILEATAGLADLTGPLGDLGYYRSVDASFNGVPLMIGRTGYTGEDGFELYIASDAASGLWQALAHAGAAFGLVPAGLAARDTLRLEAGMPLYGHELGLDILPAQAGLGRVVNLKKDDFVGRAASEVGPADDARVLVGLASEGRRAGRAGYAVLAPIGGEETCEPATGEPLEVGTVTSGALSPTLGHPIALAYVDPGLNTPGTTIDIDVRGTRIAATVVTLPFYTRKA